MFSEMPKFRKIMEASAKYKQQKITMEVMFSPLRVLCRKAKTNINTHTHTRAILNAWKYTVPVLNSASRHEGL